MLRLPGRAAASRVVTRPWSPRLGALPLARRLRAVWRAAGGVPPRATGGRERLCAAVDERTLLVCVSPTRAVSPRGLLLDVSRVARAAHAVPGGGGRLPDRGTVAGRRGGLEVDFLLEGPHMCCGALHDERLLYVRPGLLPSLETRASVMDCREDPSPSSRHHWPALGAQLSRARLNRHARRRDHGRPVGSQVSSGWAGAAAGGRGAAGPHQRALAARGLPSRAMARARSRRPRRW
jgi:hypothetical protein